jgi:uncharacterized BrkB/YihY/UPF0761 family membrane protein
MQRVDELRRSRANQFVTKLLQDEAPNLAALLAWGMLSTLLPLLMGILAVAGLLLRDPEVVEVDCNPVLVRAGCPLVVDALVVKRVQQ